MLTRGMEIQSYRIRGFPFGHSDALALYVGIDAPASSLKHPKNVVYEFGVRVVHKMSLPRG